MDGRPTDPLSGDRVTEAAERETDDTTALERPSEARPLLAERLTSELMQTTTRKALFYETTSSRPCGRVRFAACGTSFRRGDPDRCPQNQRLRVLPVLDEAP